MFLSTSETRKRAKYAGLGWRMTKGAVVITYRDKFVAVAKSRRGVADHLFSDALNEISNYKYDLVRKGDIGGRGNGAVVATNAIERK